MMVYGEEGHGVWLRPLFIGLFERGKAQAGSAFLPWAPSDSIM